MHGRRIVTRRNFLQSAAGGAIAAAVGVPLLAACSTPSGPSAATPASGAPNASASSGAIYPTYIPFNNASVKADYHDADPSYDDGYNNYPANPFKSWQKDPPGLGSTVNVFQNAYNPIPTPHDQNTTWQAIEKQLNATVDFNIIGGPFTGDYPAKLAAIIAGNDLPDIIHLHDGYAATGNLPEFIKAKCADLTPYLGGDAARDYPNLAAIPTYAWKNSVSAIDGKLYMVPLQRYLPGFSGVGGAYFFKNTDAWDKVLGAGYMPKNADDFKKALLQLNRPNDNYWAIGNNANSNFGLAGYLQMFGAPNFWRLESNGHLTYVAETDEYKAALGYLRDLWAAGVFHPDSNGSGGQSADFAGGRFATTLGFYGNAYALMWRQGLQQNPPNHFQMIDLFAHDGGKPEAYLTGGFISMNVLKQAPADRIKELLRIMDWLAAPFGSQEDLLLSYGLPGQDFTPDANGNPIPTQNGRMNASYVPWQYISVHPYVSYQADLPGYARTQWDMEHQIIPVGIKDPTLGYYSATKYSKGVAADQAFSDGVNGIILGRDPISNFDTVLKTWQSAAGDQIRKEYMDAMAAAK